MFYVERFTGQIRRVKRHTGRERVWTRLNEVGTINGEQGVLGLAVDPRWARGPRLRWLYVYYTRSKPGGQDRNRIVRVRRLGGSVQVEALRTLRASTNHNGGVLHFGPDGKLYAVTGDTRRPELAQDVARPEGKVLRMSANGSAPLDNPIPGSVTYSYGHRNSFGFAFDPLTGNLWQTENGPWCNDEINLIRPARNYGWGPLSADPEACPDTNQDGLLPVPPEWVYAETPALTGAAFCDRCRLGSEVKNNLLVGSFQTSSIRLLTLSEDRDDLEDERQLYDHARHVLAVEAGPGGTIFFSDRFGIYRLMRG